MKTTVTPTTAGTIWVSPAPLSDDEIDKLTWDAPIGTTVGTYSVPSVFDSVSAPKGKTLVARTRLNRGTIEAYGSEHAKEVVKSRLVKELLQQLIDSGVVKITSDVSSAGAATFTATVVVNETP